MASESELLLSRKRSLVESSDPSPSKRMHVILDDDDDVVHNVLCFGQVPQEALIAAMMRSLESVIHYSPDEDALSSSLAADVSPSPSSVALISISASSVQDDAASVASSVQEEEDVDQGSVTSALQEQPEFDITEFDLDASVLYCSTAPTTEAANSSDSETQILLEDVLQVSDEQLCCVSNIDNALPIDSVSWDFLDSVEFDLLNGGHIHSVEDACHGLLF